MFVGCGAVAVRTARGAAYDKVYLVIAVRAFATCALERRKDAPTQKSKTGFVRECKRLVGQLRPDGKAVSSPELYSIKLQEAGK